jgi:glycosyltransferase involved in cell wall biosynthesis
MKILQIISTLDPTFGGPQGALLQTSRVLDDLGHQSEVVTQDDLDAPWIASFPAVVHALGPSIGKYRYNKRLIPWLKVHSSDYDAVLVHGIWQFQSFGTWLAARSDSLPYFVFIHGALDPWFKRAYPFKHIKKWLYWPWAEYRVLRDAQAVLFTCDEERMLARQSFWLYQANEAVVDYGILDPDGDPHEQRKQFFRSYPALRNKRLLLFLSRIHQKKGCDLLVEAFARVAARDPALQLVMAGPDQEGWQKKLMVIAKARGVADRITWTGMLTGGMKWGAFHAAEVFVLPSHSENFGIVVAESLACGMPVLISDKVNIWREIVQDGAGVAEPDTLDGTVTLLERWLGLSADEIHRMRIRARACFKDRFEIQQATNKLVSVIEQCLLARTGKAIPSGSVAGQECKP